MLHYRCEHVMAFRRLTLGERFALRGATKYRTLLVDPATVGDPKKCGWGFVPQSTLVHAMINERQKYQFHVSVDTRGKFSQPEGISKDFERYNIDFSEFKVRAWVCACVCVCMCVCVPVCLCLSAKL